MSERRCEKMWAIVGTSCGLYCGTHLTRRDAIAAHTNAYRGVFDDVYEVGLSPYSFGKLNTAQREVWERCKRKGDRAVRVEVTYPEHHHRKEGE